MSLVLALTYEQAADNKSIILYDNSTGWGTDGDPDVGDVDDATITFTIGATSHAVDVLAIFTAAGGDSDNLIFTIDAGDLGGASGDVISDEIYYLDYQIDDGGAGPWDMVQEVIPVIGVVRDLVYAEMLNAPSEIAILDELVSYAEQDWPNIINPLLNYAHYKAVFINTSQSQYSVIENIFTALQNRVTP